MLNISFTLVLLNAHSTSRQKIEQVDVLRDKIVAVLKSERLATNLEHVISEGRTPVGNLQSWVKGKTMLILFSFVLFFF